MQRLLFAAGLGLALFGLASTSEGQVNPFDPIAPVNPVNPVIQYPVTPEAGAHLICVQSFKGPKATEQANELAAAVRRDHKLPAYVFAKGREERLKQQRHLEELRKKYGQSRFPIERIEEQYAVLVGGYKDMDAARSALETVRRLKPPDKFFISGERVQPGKSDKGESGVFLQEIRINPFNSAFVVRNPTIQQEQQAENKADPLMKKLNADETYSLLQCKKPWTLVVSVFQGLPVVQAAGTAPSVMDKLMGRNPGEQLAASALNAHNLAEALRKLGFEAYVLHTRYNSVVTIGAYDTKDDRRMQQVQEALHNRFKLDGGMQFMAQPMPMEVPQS
jgi:hypothetical protein